MRLDPTITREYLDSVLITEIDSFRIFLCELEKYETFPEDVGHCFVTWQERFSIYVTYCKNHPDATKVLIHHAGTFFDVSSVQHGA